MSPPDSGAAVSCAQRELLTQALCAADEQLRRTTVQLDARIGVAARAEYESLRARAKRASATSKLARQALSVHAAEHGC